MCKMQPISEYLLGILLLFLIHLSVLVVWRYNPYGSLCTVSFHQKIMTISFLPFQFGSLLLFFSVVVVTSGARLSSSMWNKSGECGHSCLLPDLNRNDFNFCTLSMMLAVGLSYMTQSRAE